MEVISYVWVFLQILIGYNLVLPLTLLLLFLVVRPLQHAKTSETNLSLPDYAVIVTAYQQTDMLPAVVSSILKLNYTNYLVYVVADNCDVSNLNFEDERVVLLRPPEVIASNTGSHFYAIRNFKRDHSHLTIIDSDNLVDAEYLNQLNLLFSRGYQAVQGIRAPKNLDTTYACLDAARDIYYHFYDGKVLFTLGSSATLAGSAMAFTTSLYRDCLEKLNIKGAGFDKVLQYQIVKRGHRIAFNEHAIVYDEKTSQSSQLVKQRSRWINTWFRYCRFGLVLLLRGLSGFNLNQTLFGMTLLRPPLFIFLLLSLIFAMINIWTAPGAAWIWLAAMICFVTGFAAALLASRTPSRVYRSLVNIPVFMFFQVVSLIKARSANRISVATKHYHNEPAAKDG